MKKQLNLVLLPTENKSNIVLHKDSNILEYVINQKSVTGESKYFSCQELYAISDERLKIGDWFIYKTENKTVLLKAEGIYADRIIINKHIKVGTWISLKHCKKVVITTDESLRWDNDIQVLDTNFTKYPTFINDFINTYVKRYNSKNPILEVIVEYDCNHSQMPDKVIDVLKVNTDNTVDVSFNKGLDLQNLSEKLNEALSKETEESLTEWLKNKRKEDKLYTKEEVVEFTLKCLDYFKPMNEWCDEDAENYVKQNL